MCPNCSAPANRCRLLPLLMRGWKEMAVSDRGGPDKWCPKMLREVLCKQSLYAPDPMTRQLMDDLARVLDLHRPLKHGKHGDLHTSTCGCSPEARGRRRDP